MMRYIGIALSGFVVLLLTIGSAVSAQSPLLRRAGTEESRKLIVEYGVFPTERPDTLRLEVYYQVYNYAFNFEPDNGLFRTRYVATITVADKAADTVTARMREEREVVVDNVKKTTSATDFRTAQANFNLPPGKYEVRFLIEALGATMVLRRDFDVTLQAYDSKLPKLSDVELVQAAAPVDSSNSGGAFAKGNITVVPSLTGTFSGEGNGRLLYYLEIHQGADSSEEVTIQTSLRHDGKGLIYRDSLTTPLTGPVTRQLREVSLADFLPGDYELAVSLHGRRYKQLDEKKRGIRVPWTARSVLRHDWDAALDQLELIAEGKEIKEMRKIDALPERAKAIDEFWAKRDPDPTTELNEIQVAFYHRVDVANRMFSILNQDGWRTDRGRVLIRHGEPDQIDDFPLVPDRYPYQEWHYYRDGRYRKFVFVDVNEDGDYRLQYPYDGLNQRPDF